MLGLVVIFSPEMPMMADGTDETTRITPDCPIVVLGF